ncbi:hypothetical protein R3P38DRAFT_3362738 [Favolaschia claudopus]|uniref:Uncharacterized protein n=1 Tax=Favolaschia claudopus TaxID=2862362 RepID=A0AAW0ALP3_9AGAR
MRIGSLAPPHLPTFDAGRRGVSARVKDGSESIGNDDGGDITDVHAGSGDAITKHNRTIGSRDTIINNNNNGDSSVATNNNNNNGGDSGGNVIININNNNNGNGSSDDNAPADPSFVCPPTDLNGGVLTDPVSGSGPPTLTCRYSESVDCLFSASSGALIKGNDGCPSNLAQRNTSSSGSSSNPSSASDPDINALYTCKKQSNNNIGKRNERERFKFSDVHTILHGRTNSLLECIAGRWYRQSKVSKIIPYRESWIHRRNRKLSPGAAAGIAIGIILLVLLAALLFSILLCRRRQRRGAERSRHRLSSAPDTVSPFYLAEADAGSGTGVGIDHRIQLDAQLADMKERISDLEVEQSESRTTSQSEATFANLVPNRLFRIGGLPSSGSARIRSEQVVEHSDAEARLQAAREHISVLMDRINALEARDDYSLGEPPPEYV